MESNDPYEELEIYLKQINVSAKMPIEKHKEIKHAQVAGKLKMNEWKKINLCVSVAFYDDDRYANLFFNIY